MKRIFDIFFSFVGIVLLLPELLLISILVLFDSRGGIFYLQTRVGKNGRDFKIIKFRTMHTGSDKKGFLTVGANDSRITRIGLVLRKHKLDELPQLFNVFIGNMSFVGPRPEVRKYVNMYNTKQLKVLNVKPGITDPASIAYRNENELLAKSDNPEQTYIEVVMPAKLEINLKYIHKATLKTDLSIIGETIKTLIH